MASTIYQCECGNPTVNVDLCDDCIDTTPRKVRRKRGNDVDSDYGFPIVVRGQRLVQVY